MQNEIDERLYETHVARTCEKYFQKLAFQKKLKKNFAK